MRETDDLDILIDSALSSYAEPRPGLEGRMLARISGVIEHSARRRIILLSIVAPVATSLLLLIYLTAGWRAQRGQVAYTPAVPTPAHVVTAPAGQQVPQSPSRVRKHDGRQLPDRVRPNTIERPKLDVFPTPRPLSTGERAMIRFAAEAPEADRKALVEAQERVDQPLNITAIRIPPLQSPEENH